MPRRAVHLEDARMRGRRPRGRRDEHDEAWLFRADDLLEQQALEPIEIGKSKASAAGAK